jgi:3-deoxy-D-manno-octulosonic-acid transferase
VNALDALYLPLAILTAPAWAGKRRQGWRERFGHIEPPPRKARPRLMLHAVSVGEVSALRTLVPLLTPHAEVLVTATTDSGLARARDLFSKVAHVARYPLDFSWCVRRFLDAARPDAVALVELEVWPNFVGACAARGIPVAIVNGRLSERSYRGYSRIRGFFRRRLRLLRAIAVQDDDYARRFLSLGADPATLRVTGSMKWDAAPPGDGVVAGADELAQEFGIDRSRPLIVAGSTGPGEEALLHAACPTGAQLLCAPRKPERFDQAQRDLPGCARLTSIRAGLSRPGSASGRFLLDTIGELRKAYALADVVVMGRSFGDLFGSDPIEPAALGKPVVIGPAVDDFARVVASLEAHRGIRRATRTDLAGVLAGLLERQAERGALVAGARACIAAERGASARNAELLLGMLPRGGGEATMAGRADGAASPEGKC